MSCSHCCVLTCMRIFRRYAAPPQQEYNMPHTPGSVVWVNIADLRVWPALARPSLATRTE